MPRTTDSRIDNLERVALEFESAQFATRHILALMLSKLKQHEAETCLRELRSMGNLHKAELGDSRLTGYLDELDAIEAAAHPAPSDTSRPLRFFR